MLHSYNKGLTWTDSEDDGIQSLLRTRIADVEAHTEYLDAKTVSGEEHDRKFFDLMKYKYASIDLKVVIASDDDAYNFYLRHRKELFPKVPLVFCGVNYFKDSQREGLEDLITGVVEAFDIPNTLRTALRLQPQTSRIIVINDATITGRANKKIITEEVIPEFGKQVTFVFFEDLTMEELLKKIGTLSKSDLILLMTFNRDRSGRVFNYDQSIALISKAAKVSIYGVWDFYLDKGIAGGMLTSGVDQGKMAAEMALRILDGEKVRNIPVVRESPNKYKFDYNQLRRFAIKLSDLPPSSILINKPVSFYSLNKGLVWGTVAGFLSLAVIIALLLANIRQRRQGEAALRKSETQIRTLLTNINVGVYRATPDGHFTQANPAMAKIFGYKTPELFMQTRVIDIYRKPEDRNRFLEQLRAKQAVKDVEIEMKKKDGILIWTSLSVTAQYDEQGGIKWLDGVMEDITDRKLAEEALQKAHNELEMRVQERTSDLLKTNVLLQTEITERKRVQQELEAANAELRSAQSQLLQQEKMASIGQLAAGVAHEINNPMGFIISNLGSLERYVNRMSKYIEVQADAITKLLADGNTHGHEIAESLEMQKASMKIAYMLGDLNNLIKESLEGADRVKEIVQDLKSFSRLDEAEYKMADINAGIESTINIVWNEIKYKASVKKTLAKIPLTQCNLGQLNQVFLNILLNAAQAMQTQGEIEIKTLTENGNILIEISDTGSGIPPEKVNRIFEPFFTTKEVGKGTGLGLSIAYDIIKKHKGEIHVESEVGKGTTFSIIIPIVEG